MKIELYLYQYELIFTGIWNCMCCPNVGEKILLFPFLSEGDRKNIWNIQYTDIASDIDKSSLSQSYKNMSLLMVLRTTPCIIKEKIWDYRDNEWICSFTLKV